MTLGRVDVRALTLCALLALCACGVWASPAHAAAAWQAGAMQESTITDCVSIIDGTPVQTPGAAATAYVYEDYSNPPPAGQTYYLAVTVFGVGDACTGMAADIDLTLPQDTSLNISSATPVTCFPLTSSGNKVIAGAQDTSGACPQDPQSLGNDEYSFDMARKSGFDATSFYPSWAIPQGAGVEIHIPVVSSAAFTGTATADVTMADGNNDPKLTPSVPVIGGAAPTTSPSPGTSFAVNAPASGNITNTAATLSAQFVYDYSFTPIGASIAWGTSAASTPQALTFEPDFASVPYAIEFSTNVTGLQPGCTYHWNANLLGNGASALATSGDQTFTTTGSGGNCSASAVGASSGGNGSNEIYRSPPLMPTGSVPNGLTPPPLETTTTTTTASTAPPTTTSTSIATTTASTTSTSRTIITISTASCLVIICHSTSSTTTTTTYTTSSPPTTSATTTTTSSSTQTIGTATCLLATCLPCGGCGSTSTTATTTSAPSTTTTTSSSSPSTPGAAVSTTSTSTQTSTTKTGSAGVLGFGSTVGRVAAFTGFRCATPQRGRSIACSVKIADAGSKLSLVAYATPPSATVSRKGKPKATPVPIKIGTLAIARAKAGQRDLKLELSQRGVALLLLAHKLVVTLDLTVTEPGATIVATGGGSITLNAPVAHLDHRR